MPQKSNKNPYKLIAQHGDDKIIIKILEQQLHIIKTAHEVLTDTTILKKFSVEDVAIIGVIAGMAVK